MPEKPKLSPQGFSRGGAGVQSSAGIGEAPSLRGVSGVTDVGTQTGVAALLSMADDSKRLQAMSAGMFEDQLKEIQTAQAIEAEAVLSRSTLAAQTKMKEAHLKEKNEHNIAQAGMTAFDETFNTSLGNQDLTQFQREYISRQKEQIRSSAAANSLKVQDQARRDKSLFDLQEAQQSWQLQVADNPTLRQGFIDKASELVDNMSIFSEVEKQKILDGMKQSIDFSAGLGLVKSQPEAAIKLLKSGELGNLDLKQREALLADADQQIRKNDALVQKDVSDRQARFDAELQVSISRAPLDELPTFSELDKLRSDGKLSDNQWVSRNSQLTARLKADNSNAEKLALGKLMVDNGLAVNSENEDQVKGFNLYYDSIQPIIAQMEPQAKAEYITNIIDKQKVIPDTLKGEMKIAARSNDPDRLSVAANLIDTVSTQSPAMLEQLVSSAEIDRIRMVNDRINQGYDPKEATRIVDQDLAPKGKAQLEAANDEIRTLIKDKTIDYVAKTRGIYEGFFSSTITPEGNVGAIETLDRASALYRVAFEDAYRRNRNVELSTKAAEAKVRGRFSKSEVNGDVQLMEFAPEAKLSIPNIDDSWMRKQIIDRAKEVAKDSLISPDIRKRLERDVRIVNDPFVTPRTWNAGNPVYKLIIPDVDGLPVVLDEEFTFDPRKMLDERKERLKKSTEDISSKGVVPSLGL